MTRPIKTTFRDAYPNISMMWDDLGSPQGISRWDKGVYKFLCPEGHDFQLRPYQYSRSHKDADYCPVCHHEYANSSPRVGNNCKPTRSLSHVFPWLDSVFLMSSSGRLPDEIQLYSKDELLLYCQVHGSYWVESDTLRMKSPVYRGCRQCWLDVKKYGSALKYNPELVRYWSSLNTMHVGAASLNPSSRYLFEGVPNGTLVVGNGYFSRVRSVKSYRPSM